MIRRLLAVVGVVGAVGGLVLVVRPDLATFGGETLLVVVGVLAVVQGVRVTMQRRRHAPRQATTPDPETLQDLPVPGDDLDETLATVRRRPPRSLGPRAAKSLRRRRERIRSRIEAAAVETVVRQHGCTRERARLALETGEWTDDPYAAAFFTGELTGVGRGEWLRRRLSSEPPFARRARRAAQAVADLAEAERVEPLAPVGPEADPDATARDGRREVRA